MPMTVTRLARACGLSRTTVLYYETMGLLKARRNSGNYRVYGPADLERLRQIRVYRDAGLTIGDIRSVLDQPRSDAAVVLERRLAELGKEIENAGWTFFYMAGEIRTSGFGFNDQSRTDRAVAHVIDAVKREKCNCLEITQMRRRSFLGLPYTSLVAHARHIQRSRSFHDLSHLPARIPFRSREWLYDQPATVRSKSPFAGEAVQAWENEGGSAQLLVKAAVLPPPL